MIAGGGVTPEFRSGGEIIRSRSMLRVTNCTRLVDARDISPKKPLVGFSLVNVSGTCTNGISLANITEAKLKNLHVIGYQGVPFISLRPMCRAAAWSFVNGCATFAGAIAKPT